MDNMKIEVINYLGMHAKVNNKQIEAFIVSKLKEAFPELDEFLLKKIESEWRKARHGMKIVEPLQGLVNFVGLDEGIVDWRLYHYDIGYHNELLTILCRVVYAILGIT